MQVAINFTHQHMFRITAPLLAGTLVLAGCAPTGPYTLRDTGEKGWAIPFLLPGCLAPRLAQGAATPSSAYPAVIRVLVSDQGVPLSTTITKPSDSADRDQAVAAALLKCEFLPGMTNGRLAARTLDVPYTWPVAGSLLGMEMCFRVRAPVAIIKTGALGKVVVRFTRLMGPPGFRVEVVESSGHEALDTFAKAIVDNCLLHPEVLESMPIGEPRRFAYLWKLADD